MPAITSLTISATGPFGRALVALAGSAGRALRAVGARLKNRRDAMRLTDLDDRMLADIGLNRSDLRDAFAELPWRDPSDVLTRRAAERRRSRTLSDPACLGAAQAASAVFTAPARPCYPPADGASRYV